MKLAAYQKELLLTGRLFGILMLLWRRQGAKTTTFAWQALRWMLEQSGILVTFSTCSLALGAEMTERETSLLTQIVSTIRDGADPRVSKVESNADGLEWYDIADLYQHGKLEVSLWHDNTRRSRTKVIAANYATARGYSGYVLLDEVGFIKDFKSFYEAIEPVFSRNPDYRLWMATTPPEDDAHFSYDLTAYPPGMEFVTNARGNWYENESGMPVHRVSAQDAEAAGVMLYDSKSRKPLTAEEHRAKAFDKVAWDRNYGLIFTQGGVSAVGLLALNQAQSEGAKRGCLFSEDELPADWDRLLNPALDTAVGVDPATTEKEKSNPFAICVTQRDDIFIARLVFRFRSADPYKCKAILREVRDRVNPRAIVIDATSERFWAAEVKAELEPGTCVELIVNSEKTTYEDEKMTWKTYLGNIGVNAIDDRQAALPSDKRLRDDFRLVRRLRGGFDNQLDNAGHHGDTFDGWKNSIHGLLISVGSTEAAAVQVGGAAPAASRHSSGRLSMTPTEETQESTPYAG